MDKFRIVRYDEVKDVDRIAMLYYLSLNWPIDSEGLKRMRMDDDRYLPEFGLFAVTSDGTVAGGVFLMQIPVETVNGKINVGGISAVATKPGFQRKGVMTTLVKQCHGIFLERNLDYCFLTTRKTLVAHGFYEKMGYRDLKIDEIAWKTAGKSRSKKQGKTIEVTSFEQQDSTDVYHVFKKVAGGSYGFVHRPPDFLKARYECGRIEPLKKMRLAKHNGKISGYAYWESTSKIHTCVEVLALDEVSFSSLLLDAETRFPNEYVAVHCEGLVSNEISWLRSAGYIVIPSYGVIMVKSLNKQRSLESTRRLFGVTEGIFRMGEWDST